MARDFSPDDLFLQRRILELDAHPHEERVAVTLQWPNREQNRHDSAIYAVALEGDEPPQRLTQAEGSSDNTPRWSPDGRQLAFVSSRDGDSPQVWLLPTAGGEAWPLSRFEQGVVTLAWRPDSAALLVTCPLKAEPSKRGAISRGDNDLPEDGGPELAWRLPYKMDGVGYTLRREIHLFTLDLDGNSRQLTDGAFDVQTPAWSPDGRRIAFSRTREGRCANRSDVWVCDADGSHARQLSFDQATAQSPVWSPDGRCIAFAGNIDEGDAQSRVWCVPADGSGAPEPVGAEDIEVVSGTLRWRDRQSLLLVVARRGRQHAAVLHLGGRLELLVEGERQLSTLVATRQHLCFSVDHADTAGELHMARSDGSAERQRTRFNAWWQERTPLQVELRSFEVPDGDGGSEQVEGWLVRSREAAAAGRPQPLLVDVHGGPASYALLAYQHHAYWPVLCSRGWAVLALNAVGSSSYGRRFSERLRGRWGQADLPQQLAAVDRLQQEGIADERLAIAGKSYGGYLSAWAIGNSRRFRVAVISAPVTNIETHYGTSDSGYYADPYSMCGEPFINREVSRRLSPMQCAESARTPALLMQGKDDERCPKCQAEELYVTLARAHDTPAELALYPGADHHFIEEGRPSHRLDAVQRLVHWLGHWIDTPVKDDDEPARGREA